MIKNSKLVAIMIAVLVLPSIAYALPVQAAISSAPSLVSPLSDQVLTNYPRIATFKWSSVSGASSYQLEIACDTCVSKTNLYANAKTYVVSGTSYTVQVPGSDNTFRWRVRAKDSYNYGPWSSYRYFSYKTSSGSGVVSAPVINTPQNFISYPADTNVNFSWTYSGNGAGVSYEFVIEKNNGYSWPNYKNMEVWSGNTSTNLKMSEAGSYRVKIRAVTNSGGNAVYGSWSGYAYFYIEPSYLIQTLTLISPADESTVNSNYITLDWSSVSDATSYDYQVTRYDNSTWVSVANGTVTDSQTSVYLPYATYGQYSFRVRAVRNSVYGSWTEYNQFYYYGGGNYNYGAPTVYNPSNQNYTSHSIYMNWSSVSGVSTYEINVQYESNSNWYEEGTYSTSDSNYTKYFNSDNHYRMRVRAKFSDSSYGNWSEWREFRVGDSGNYNYGAPTVYNPTSGQNFTSFSSVYMSWSSISGASAYEINVQYESYGNWYEEGTYTATSANYTKYFSNNNEYRMRVRAKFSDSSYGNWSEWREFNVGTGGYTTGVPVINVPAQNATVQNSTHQVSLGWTSVYNAASYEVQMVRDGYATETIYPGNVASYNYYASANNSWYHFRVRARLNDSTYTSWSDWRYFQYYYSTSGNITSPPIVTSPTAGQIFADYNVYFSWLNASGASGYDIEFAYLSGSNWLTESTYSTTVNYYNRTFSSNNDYRVRVRAKFSDNSTTDWSDWVQFKISR